MDSLQKTYIQDVLGIHHLWKREMDSKYISEKKVLGLPIGPEPKMIFLSLVKFLAKPIGFKCVLKPYAKARTS